MLSGIIFTAQVTHQVAKDEVKTVRSQDWTYSRSPGLATMARAATLAATDSGVEPG